MNSLIVFDFDGTLVDITHLHKQAWQEVLLETGLRGKLLTYLPKEKYLVERFDSAERVRKYFLASHIDRETLKFFFDTDNERSITDSLLDLKESHLLYLLDSISPTSMSALYARNIFQGLDSLLADDYKLGIISNTRESVIVHTLRACRLDDCFSFIIGEESMRDESDNYIPKQDPRVREKIPRAFVSVLDESYYVGDDVRIDSLVARNYGMKFIQVPRKADFTLLKEWL